MGLFDKFRKTSDPQPEQHDSDWIRSFGQAGQVILISKNEWRTRVLPANLQAAWEDREKLYTLLVMALQDGFAVDILDAAKHLHEIEPDQSRSTCVYGIALLQNNRLDAAEVVLLGHLKDYGEDGYVLTNLAKVYAARNQHDKAEATLWHSLEIDPNQDNAVRWYVAIQRERAGSDAATSALQRIAAIEGSWRPQLWLAGAALENGRPAEAVALYRQCIARAGDPVPADVVMQISGDLGNHGRLD